MPLTRPNPSAFPCEPVSFDDGQVLVDVVPEEVSNYPDAESILHNRENVALLEAMTEVWICKMTK